MIAPRDDQQGRQLDCRTSDQHSEGGSGGGTRYDSAGNMTHDATGLNYYS
jgi:hypothetical protein